MKSNSNPLEQFILENRRAFDLAQPPEYCWDAVQKGLTRTQAADLTEQGILLNRGAFDIACPPEHLWSGIEQALDTASLPPANPLETFIREHRSAFDTQTPDLRVWATLQQILPGHGARSIRVHWNRTLLRIAASIALLITGIGIGMWYAGTSAQPGMAMSEVSAEYAELEQYYQRDITAKQEKLATFATYRDVEVNEDLQQMDDVMVELREELAHVPPGNREQVVRAMIENYKAKSAILERVLEHIEQQQPATINSGNHEVEKI